MRLARSRVRWFDGSVVQMDKSGFQWFTVVLKRQVKVSVVRGNEEALQAKLDRGQEEFDGTWHSQVIDEEQAELLQWIPTSLYTGRAGRNESQGKSHGTSHRRE